MQMPNCVHPLAFVQNGITYKVVSYDPLTDKQAKTVVLHHIRDHRPKKKDIGKTIKIITTITSADAGFWG